MKAKKKLTKRDKSGNKIYNVPSWVSVNGTPYAILSGRRVTNEFSRLVEGAEAQEALKAYDARVADFNAEV